MMNYRIDFEAIEWEAPMPGVRHKVHRVGNRILRLVEYSCEMAPHWCSRGHVGHILDGRMRIQFEHRIEIFGKGDGVFIPSGPEHAHQAVALTSVVTAVFAEDA